jgi:hypothetical protein
MVCNIWTWKCRTGKLTGGADSVLNDILSGLKSSESYSVLFTTSPVHATSSKSPHPDHTYEMDDEFPDMPHIDLKRDLGSRDSNTSIPTNLPLFETYQYLSPGIFMGGIVLLFFFVVLYVAVKAVASVEVSYYAFSKEMGPSAQRKQ